MSAGPGDIRRRNERLGNRTEATGMAAPDAYLDVVGCLGSSEGWQRVRRLCSCSADKATAEHEEASLRFALGLCHFRVVNRVHEVLSFLREQEQRPHTFLKLRVLVSSGESATASRIVRDELPRMASNRKALTIANALQTAATSSSLRK